MPAPRPVAQVVDVLAAIAIVAGIAMLANPRSRGPGLVDALSEVFQASALATITSGIPRGGGGATDPHPPGSVDDTAEARFGLTRAQARAYCTNHPASDQVLVEGTIRTCAAFQ